MAATGRPVKMTYTREDSLLESTKRHPFTTTIRVGAKADGTLRQLHEKYGLVYAY